MVAMKVNRVSSQWIKPEKTVVGEIPLTIFDRVQADAHVSVLFVYNTPTTNNATIKQGLAKALNFYPKLAGKISQHPFPAVILNEDSGVAVTEATVDENLDEFLPLQPSPELTQLQVNTALTHPLLMIQLTRFACGGLIVGLSAHHKVADGKAMSNFFVSWSQLVCGREVKPLPIHDQSLLRPRQPPLPEFPHQYVKFTPFLAASPAADELCAVVDDVDIENVLVHYPYDFLCRLKDRDGVKHSTFECLLAHLWKKVTVARRLGDDQVSSVMVAVNGRQRMAIPSEFFGNMVLHATPTATAKELKQKDEEHVANLISDAVSRIGSDYFQSFVDIGELNKHKDLFHAWNQSIENALSPNLEVNSWLGFPFSEVDMAGGSPYALMPSWIPVEGVVALISPPSCLEDHQQGFRNRWSSGINAVITLFPEDAELFKKIAYTLD